MGKYATYDEIGVSGYQIQTYGKNVWLKTEEAIDIFGENKKCYILALIYHASLNPPVEKQGGAYVLENGSPLPKKEVWFNGDGSMVDWDTAWTDSETGASKEEKLLADWSALHERIHYIITHRFCGIKVFCRL